MYIIIYIIIYILLYIYYYIYILLYIYIIYIHIYYITYIYIYIELKPFDIGISNGQPSYWCYCSSTNWKLWISGPFLLRLVCWPNCGRRQQEEQKRKEAERASETQLQHNNLPSGKLTVCYWKWPFIVDLPIENSDVP